MKNHETEQTQYNLKNLGSIDKENICSNIKES